MPITATTQTLNDGDRNLVMKFTGVSTDTTNESAVTKVDVSTLNPDSNGRPCTEVRIDKIYYDISDMKVQLLWGGTPDILIRTLVLEDTKDFRDFAGLSNNATTGKTGDIKFTTLGTITDATYSIILHMKKKYE